MSPLAQHAHGAWPRCFEKALRERLRAQFPAVAEDTIAAEALRIDGQVRALIRSNYTVKIGRKPRQWSNPRSRWRYNAVSYSLTRRPTLGGVFDRLERAARLKNDWIWAKAWHESPFEAIALLESVAGPEGLWGKVPSHLPLDPRWVTALSRAGARMRPDEPQSSGVKFSVNVAGAPIPHPTSVAPLIAKAKRLIRAGRSENFLSDLHKAEIVRAFERLAGIKATQPTHSAGSSHRSGPIIDFFNDLEAFYNERLPAPFNSLRFNVQNSGSAWDRIFSALGRM